MRLRHMLSIALLSAAPVTGAWVYAAPVSPDLSFFITSAGLGKGADLGGLAGADQQDGSRTGQMGPQNRA